MAARGLASFGARTRGIVTDAAPGLLARAIDEDADTDLTAPVLTLLLSMSLLFYLGFVLGPARAHGAGFLVALALGMESCVVYRAHLGGVLRLPVLALVCGAGAAPPGWGLMLVMLPLLLRTPSAPAGPGASRPLRSHGGAVDESARPLSRGPGSTTPSPGPRPTTRPTRCPTSCLTTTAGPPEASATALGTVGPAPRTLRCAAAIAWRRSS